MGPNPRPNGARETTDYGVAWLVFARATIMASIIAAIGITVSATLAQPKWLSIWPLLALAMATMIETPKLLTA